MSSLAPARYPTNIVALPAPDDVTSVLESWVAEFSRTLNQQDVLSLCELFFTESYWRDHLVCSWNFRTLKGPQAITQFVKESLSPLSIQVSINLKVEEDQKPCIAAIDSQGEIRSAMAFLVIDTAHGQGRGYLRLLQDATDGGWKAFTLFTTLYGLKERIESVGHARPSGVEEQEETNICGGIGDQRNGNRRSEPTVLIVGAGQAGLATSARLSRLGVSNLVIDQNMRVGDSWRQRYSRLVLHDPVWYNHFPYMPFPETWPVFTSKEKLADWLETYAITLEIKTSTSTLVKQAKWIGDRWHVSLRRTLADGTLEMSTIRPRHIIIATGQAGKMRMPKIEGMDSFRGARMCHSSQFTSARDTPGQGRAVVVVGSGTSAHDIAQEYCLNGYSVTMLQRSATCIDPCRYIRGKGLYKEDGPQVEEADLLTQSLPLALLKRLQIDTTDQIHREYDEFFERLERAGFRVDRGPDGAGRKFRYFDNGGGYYIDVGASSLIIEGRIKIRQSPGIQQIEPQGVVLSDGSRLEASEIVFATGFNTIQDTARDILGDQVVGQCKEVWGLDEEGELNSAWRRSGHPGLWFAAGNLSMTRYYSKLLALHILGCELDLCRDCKYTHNSTNGFGYYGKHEGIE